MSEPLSEDRIREALADLPGWALESGKLARSYRFRSFPEAISFVVRVAFEAEAQKHHPDLRNVYNRVDIALSTHDAGDRVTDKDVKLARAIQAIAWV